MSFNNTEACGFLLWHNRFCSLSSRRIEMVIIMMMILFNFFVFMYLFWIFTNRKKTVSKAPPWIVMRVSALLYLPELWTRWGRFLAPVPPSWRYQGSGFWRSFAPAHWAAPVWNASCAASASAGLWSGRSSAAAVAAASPAPSRSPACPQSWILQWRCLHPAGEWFLQQSLNQEACLPDAPGLELHLPAGIWELLGVRVSLQHPSSLRGWVGEGIWVNMPSTAASYKQSYMKCFESLKYNRQHRWH